jgi:hypothetical protein
MGFWRFGNDSVGVEMASRIVTATTRSGHQLRGKLTIHFAGPHKQPDADAVADQCASETEAILTEAPRPEQVIGAESGIVAALHIRLPSDLPPIRAIDLAALHVVGDPSASAAIRRASSATMRAVPISVLPPSSSDSPLPPSVRSGELKRRSNPNLMRALKGQMFLPVGSPTEAMGAAIAPIVRDTAGRMLVGFLRTYDLIVLRGIALDEDTAENIVPVSDVLPGGFEASRAEEVGRWEASLGNAILSELRREICVASAYFTYASLLRAEIPQNIVQEVLHFAVASAFGDMNVPVPEISRYMNGGEGPAATILSAGLCLILTSKDAPAAIGTALTPLLASLEEDLDLGATLVKNATAF